MRRTLPIFLTLLMTLVLAATSLNVLAQTSESINVDEPDQDDVSPVSRVARVSFIQGDASFLRAGVTEWAPAVENLPLLTGDQVFVARGGRAEIQLTRGNYIRLSENTDLTIAELSEGAARFEVSEGTVVLRLERVASAFGRLELDTPNTAVLLSKDGLYRIDVEEKRSELIVRDGEAEASTDEGSLKVRQGYRLLVDASTGGKLELALDTSRDDWDQWNYERDVTVASAGANTAPDDVTSYETTYSNFYGASDLSSYGTWTSYSSYGRCWIPRVSANWAPYRFGQWIWIPAAGWTWLSSEPWGWAPYHYGRWSFLSGLGWAWIPGFGSYGAFGYRDYHWRPALVYFFNWSTPTRSYVGWHPLAPGEHWRRPDHRDRDDRRGRPRHPTPRDGRRRPHDGEFVIQPVMPGNGMTILPVDAFSRGDRVAERPAAPNRDHQTLIGRGAKPGLPEIKPNPISAAPALDENDRRRGRGIAIPPVDVVRRPVVTRSPNIDASANKGAPRERRLISPPKRGEMKGPALIEQPDHGVSRMPGASAGSDSRDPSPVIQLPNRSAKEKGKEAVPGGKESGSDSKEEARPRDRAGKETGNGGIELAVPRQELPPSETREQLRQERRLERERQDHSGPENRDQLREERRLERDRQQQSHPENRDQVREQPRQEKEQQRETPRSEKRDQVREQPRQEKEQHREASRPENRDQGRQERQQQKEQRQQPQENRKRP